VVNNLSNRNETWQFAIDRGGTFTDIIGISSEGNLHTIKLLSKSNQYEDAVVEGIRRVLGITPEDSIPQERVKSIRMGTTVATNALLERKGEPPALLITRGFRDLIEIGHQARPDLFSIIIKKPKMLYCKVIEVTERIGADGSIITPLDEDAVYSKLIRLKDAGITSVSIALIHAWKNPVHEKAIAAAARKLGFFTQVSVSYEIMPVINMLGRSQTTLVDAYLSPVLKTYVDLVRKSTGDIRLQFMQSSGGLTEAHRFTGKDAIISGPAGGVVGCAAIAEAHRIKEVIGFDMGGTSTDVCRYDGYFERVFENTTGGISFQAPMLNVVTVAAGGGSIAWFDGRKLNVGPESAGADPGPACYGLGGPLTLTDANLIAGRLLPEHFPKEFGPGGNQPLQVDAARRRFEEITGEINQALTESMNPESVALGFIRIANEKMCRPIKQISISRGLDIRNHALICFGGAGGQHACAIAKILGIRKILIHPLAGLLSAYGIATADQIRTASESVLEILTPDSLARIQKRFDELAEPLKIELKKFGVPPREIKARKSLDLRPLGTDSALNIFCGETSESEKKPAKDRESFYKTDEKHLGEIIESFHKTHKRYFGFVPDNVPVEAVTLRVEVIGGSGLIKRIKKTAAGATAQSAAEPLKICRTWFEEGLLDTPVYLRKDLPPAVKVKGPAMVVEAYSTIVVEPEFEFFLEKETGVLIIEPIVKNPTKFKHGLNGVKCDPVMLEVFNNLFMSVAEQMGTTLAQTAHSTNIKERLDFSCAVFDSKGNLVANAPHIPVHLGAMGESVKAVIAERTGRMQPGDVYVTNNPYKGGSHLPDITVISPVFDIHGQLNFFTASRGHHADIGGISPGSMPPGARLLEEEGVVLDNKLLVRDGKFNEREIRSILSSGPYPARNIDERISDLRSQVAANQAGIRELTTLIKNYGIGTVQAYMLYIRQNAAQAMGDALLEFVRDQPVFESSFEDSLDNGEAVKVRIRIERGGKASGGLPAAVVDFTGTAPQLDGNLNAPLAVTRSAVLYVFRTLIHRDIPLNEGCMQPIKLIVPDGCLLNPRHGAAVGGGNVETSQRIVDVLYGALGVAAASQGTMNNFLFGKTDGSGRQYYETIGGGSGAVEGNAGASAVQVHMTNTRITDPEVLEHRYPEVLIERFEIRRGSGGAGRYRGGDGVIRSIRFLKPREVTILSQRRVSRPYGLKGGSAGQKGQNLLVKTDGTIRKLGGKTTLKIQAGETVVIKTPGGGGFGKT